MLQQPNHRLAFVIAAVLCAFVFLNNRPSAAQDLPDASVTNVNPKLQVLLRMDRNHDGILQPNEIPAEAGSFVDSIVKQYETNSATEQFEFRLSDSRSIDLEVLKNAASIVRRSKSRQVVLVETSDLKTLGNYSHILISNYDQDRDGELSQDEYQRLGKNFDRWDYNRDGSISPAEITVRFRAMQESDSRQSNKQKLRTDIPLTFAELDANVDGQIQVHEFANPFTDESAAEFYAKDRNQDGLITLREWLQHQVDQETTSRKD